MKPLAAHLLPPPEPHRVSISRTFPIFGDAAYANDLLACADKYRHYEITGQGFFEARQGTAVGPHFLVINRRGQLMWTSSRGGKSRFRTKQPLHKIASRYAIVESATTRQFDGSVIVIGGKASSQFFHWIVEIVPRLVMVKQAFRKKRPPILLRPLAHHYQRDSLSILGLEATEVSEDVVAAPHILFPSHMVLPIGRGCLSPDLVPLSQRFAAAIRAPRGHGQRIYISRHDARERRVDNEQEVMDLLSAYGFRRVLLSELPLAEQVSLFRSAEAVIAAHGGGLVSTLFCQPGTKVIELWPVAFPYVSPFWNIASLAALDYAMCICSAGVNAAGRFNRRGITADLGLLRTTLARLSIDLRRSSRDRKEARSDAKRQQQEMDAARVRQERKALRRQQRIEEARRQRKEHRRAERLAKWVEERKARRKADRQAAAAEERRRVRKETRRAERLAKWVEERKARRRADRQAAAAEERRRVRKETRRAERVAKLVEERKARRKADRQAAAAEERRRVRRETRRGNRPRPA